MTPSTTTTEQQVIDLNCQFENEPSWSARGCGRWCHQIYFGRNKLQRRLPLISWLPSYSLGDLKGDLIAGLSVGFTLVPHSLALALLAGLPVQYGLYSSFVGPLVYIVLGSCKDITIGPTAIMAIMTAGHIHKGGLDYSLIVTFLVGLIQLTYGLLNFGFIVDLISFPVISGFTAAAAITILVAQLKLFFGIVNQASLCYKTGSKFIDDLLAVGCNLNQINPWDTLVGLSCLLILISMKVVSLSRQKAATIITTKLPQQPQQQKQPSSNQVNGDEKRGLLSKCSQDDNGDGDDNGVVRDGKSKFDCVRLLLQSRNVIVVIVCMATAYLLDGPFTLTQQIDAGWPSFVWPPLFSVTRDGNVLPFGQIIHDLSPGFIAIAMLSLLESVAIAKSFESGAISLKKLDASQEMIALGASNLIGSCFGSFPVSGSFTRSAILSSSGGRTPMSGLITGLVVLAALSPTVAPYFHFIPQATLASIVIAAVIFMVKPGDVALIWKASPREMASYLVTLISSVVFGLELGIIAGVCVSVVLVLYTLSRPRIHFELKQLKSGPSANRFEALNPVPYLLVKPNQSVFYLSAEYFKVKLEKALIQFEEQWLASQLKLNQSYSSSSSYSVSCDASDDLLKKSRHQIAVVIDGSHLFKEDVTFSLVFCRILNNMRLKGVKVICINFRPSIFNSIRNVISEETDDQSCFVGNNEEVAGRLFSHNSGFSQFYKL